MPLDTDSILMQNQGTKTADMEQTFPTFDVLLAMLRECEGVSITEINPCQCVTVETSGRPALLIVKEV